MLYGVHVDHDLHVFFVCQKGTFYDFQWPPKWALYKNTDTELDPNGNNPLK